MKICISLLLVFFAGAMSVHATSVKSTEGVTVSTQTAVAAKKTVKLDWSTLKCQKYSLNGSANYLVKSLTGTWYKIKNKNWDCIANSAVFKFDVKNCVCKVLYTESSGGGDNDDSDSCKKGSLGCGGGATTAGTTGGDDGGGATTAGTTGGDDGGGATTAGTTGGDDGGGATTAGTTGGDDGGATTAGTTGGDDGGSTTAGTTTGEVDL